MTDRIIPGRFRTEAPQFKLALVGKNKATRVFVSRYLKQKYHYKIIGLDDILDEVVRKLYGIPVNSKAVRWEQKLRMYDTWQKIDPDIWINPVIRKIHRASSSIVIPDVRYMNEIKRLEQEGFTFIRITTDPTNITSIKRLGMDTNSGATLYYEWFAPNADLYVKAKYSIYVNLKELDTARNSIDQLVKNLTK